VVAVTGDAAALAPGFLLCAAASCAAAALLLPRVDAALDATDDEYRLHDLAMAALALIGSAGLWCIALAAIADGWPALADTWIAGVAAAAAAAAVTAAALGAFARWPDGGYVLCWGVASVGIAHALAGVAAVMTLGTPVVYQGTWWVAGFASMLPVDLAVAVWCVMTSSVVCYMRHDFWGGCR
jgi:hypothetical protein